MRRPALLLATWTLLVWAVRIRNAEGAVAATTLSLTFVALAGWVLLTRARVRRAVLALAGWTIAVWLVRLTDIVALSDHGIGFKVVHVVIGGASVGLAAVAARATPRSGGRQRAATISAARRRARA